MRVELPYGSAPYAFEVSDRPVEVLRAMALGEPPALSALLESALSHPIGESLSVPAGARVTVIVSDDTRNEPRADFLNALRPRLAGARLTLAIATGTHGPTDIARLGLPTDWLRDVNLVNHDGHRSDGLVDLGVTTRGTPIRVHRCLVDADLVIATGCIRPHYFAGFGAGAKALFPGLGEATAIRINHRLKTEPGARAGIVVGNPCRDDLEEAVARISTPTFLLDGVCGPDDEVHDVVAGDLVAAFREGVRRAYPWFAVRAAPAPLVIASESPPVCASLYQAAKIAAASAPFVARGGTLVVVAECGQGIGPLDTVNEAIFRIGVLPRLPPDARLVLVSGLRQEEVEQTLLTYAPSIASVLESTKGRILVVPHAGHILAESNS